MGNNSAMTTHILVYRVYLRKNRPCRGELFCGLVHVTLALLRDSLFLVVGTVIGAMLLALLVAPVMNEPGVKHVLTESTIVILGLAIAAPLIGRAMRILYVDPLAVLRRTGASAIVVTAFTATNITIPWVPPLLTQVSLMINVVSMIVAGSVVADTTIGGILLEAAEQLYMREGYSGLREKLAAAVHAATPYTRLELEKLYEASIENAETPPDMGYKLAELLVDEATEKWPRRNHVATLVIIHLETRNGDHVTEKLRVRVIYPQRGASIAINKTTY